MILAAHPVASYMRLYTIAVRYLRAKPRVAVELTQDVPSLGYKGEIKQVKAGYARNHLIPKNLSNYATSESLERSLGQAEEVARVKQANRLRLKLDAAEMTFHKVSNTNGSLLRPLTSKNIVHRLRKSHGILIDPEALEMKHPISEFGMHKVGLKENEDMKLRLVVNKLKSTSTA